MRGLSATPLWPKIAHFLSRSGFMKSSIDPIDNAGATVTVESRGFA